MNNLFLIFNKKEWTNSPFMWTKKELDNADEKGFIGTACGIDCYITKKINSGKLKKNGSSQSQRG